MNCPGCNKEMRWLGDEQETEEYFESTYDCVNCDIDVLEKVKIIES